MTCVFSELKERHLNGLVSSSRQKVKQTLVALVMFVV